MFPLLLLPHLPPDLLSPLPRILSSSLHPCLLACPLHSDWSSLLHEPASKTFMSTLHYSPTCTQCVMQQTRVQTLMPFRCESDLVPTSFPLPPPSPRALSYFVFMVFLILVCSPLLPLRHLSTLLLLIIILFPLCFPPSLPSPSSPSVTLSAYSKL